ncbi:hypothetical protein RUM43_008725 [Polyplax serrata]|uniref:Uncharacterized protein n=1 Tax=Polyplax serrata TaxID=468196 RepID=A0AAN8PVD4_POLSC
MNWLGKTTPATAMKAPGRLPSSEEGSFSQGVRSSHWTVQQWQPVIPMTQGRDGGQQSLFKATGK